MLCRSIFDRPQIADNKRMKASEKKDKYHHGELRQATIDTAIQIVAERGIEALTLREVSQRIGVSRMAPYRHFENKSALLAAVAEEGFAMMYRYLQQTLTESPPEPLPRLQKLGIAYISFATSQPTHYRLMFGSLAVDRSIYPELHSTAAKNYNLLLQSVRECQEAGSICNDNPQEIAQMLWSLTHGLSMLIIDGQLDNKGTGTILEMATFMTKKTLEGLIIK
jgi:AcrR family transcriptional regulator